MKPILILTIFGLIKFSESSQEEICHGGNGRLLLMGNAKILGKVNVGNTSTIFVSDIEELNFLCQKYHENNDTQIIFGDERVNVTTQQSPVNRTLLSSKLRNNNGGTNKKPVKVRCVNVCNANIVVIKANVTNICSGNNSSLNNSVSCNRKVFEKAIPGNILQKNQPRILGFPVVTTYWILDPAGNGSFLACEEKDKNGTVIKVGLTNSNYDTESFNCPIDFGGQARPIIIKKKDETKTKCAVSLPIFEDSTECKSKIEESFFTYRYIPAQIIEFGKYPFGEAFPTWGLMLIVFTVLILLLLAAFASYVIYNKRKSLLTLQPQKSSNFYLETPPSEPESARTDTTLPSYHSRITNPKQTPYDNIFEEDLKIPFQDVEKRKKLLLRQLSGDPSKVSPDLFLNAQANHLDYSEKSKNKFEIDRSKFETGRNLGGGSYGSVCDGIAEGLFHPGHKTKVAIKTVNNALDYTQLHALVCEMKVLAKLEMRLNLVNMLAACTSQLDEGQLWLLIEYCPHGDMKSFLCKNREKFKMSIQNQIPINGLDERLIIKWSHSIAKGMEYLSSKKIMHGDLAARNILIGGLEGGQENYVAKISDFGLSRTFYDDIRYKKQERDTVPWKWMDVEYLQNGEFTLKSDVWSFGVVLWEILSMGQEPYVGKDIHDTINEIKAGSRLPCPNQLEGLDWLEKFYHGATVWCWQADPNLRWGFESLVEYFETYLSENELKEYKNFEEAYINMQDLINDDKTRLKRSPSYLKMSGNTDTPSVSYSKASTVQIEQPEVSQETGNAGYHKFAGAQPGDGGLVLNPPSANVSGGYITPAQAGAGGLNNSQANSSNFHVGVQDSIGLNPRSNISQGTSVSSYITMPQAMTQK